MREIFVLRDGSLIITRRRATKREGERQVKFYPYKKGEGARNVLAMLKGGHNKFLGSFYTAA